MATRSGRPGREVVLRIDGGATKTSARTMDANGKVVGEGHAGPGSLTIGPEIAAANVLAALSSAMNAVDGRIDDCRLVCGLAGHRNEAHRHSLEELLGSVGELEVMSDGFAALLGAHGGKPGAIVIVGTGSVALALANDGGCRQVGGWGLLAGDEGSGDWIGREAIRMALRAGDELAADTPALASLRCELGDRHEAMLEWLSGANATRFAQLVPWLLARADDPAVDELLDRAAAEIERLVRLAAGDDSVPVALVGGLASSIEPRLDKQLRARLVAPLGDTMDGALLRARGRAPVEVYP